MGIKEMMDVNFRGNIYIYILFKMAKFYMKEKMGLQICKMKFLTQ